MMNEHSAHLTPLPHPHAYTHHIHHPSIHPSICPFIRSWASPESTRQPTESQLPNQLSCRGSSQKLEPDNPPYDERAFSPLHATARVGPHLTLVIYISVVVKFYALAQGKDFKSKEDKLSSSGETHIVYLFLYIALFHFSPEEKSALSSTEEYLQTMLDEPSVLRVLALWLS